MQIVTKAHLVFTCFLLAKMSVVGLADSPSQPGRLVRNSNPRNFPKSQIWFKSNRIETKFCRGIQEGREKLFTKDQTPELNTNPRSIKTRLKNEERTGERKVARSTCSSQEDSIPPVETITRSPSMSSNKRFAKRLSGEGDRDSVR